MAPLSVTLSDLEDNFCCWKLSQLLHLWKYSMH